MRFIINLFFLYLLTPLVGYSQKVDDTLKYLKQKPPSITPEIFAPHLISKKNEYEFGSVFNRDATEFFME